MSALGTKPEPPRQLRERWRVAAPVQRVVALLRVAKFCRFLRFFRYFRSTFLSPVGGTLALDISNSRLGNKTVVYSAITRSIAVMLRPRRWAQMALSSEV